MTEFELTPKLIKLLMHIKRKGFVTKDTRPFLASMRFYNYLWVLRDNGLIESNGNDKGNHQKIWRLSPKGVEVANRIYDIEKIMEGENVGV